MSLFIHPYYFSQTKRVFDVILASMLVVGLSPFLIGLGIAVWIGAGWPIIFTQKRTGLNGKVFTLYKFRTMRLGAEKLQTRLAKTNEAPVPMFKLQNDPRFTGIGKWLSRTGLDELPQLMNILRGEMSFVGLRPLPIKEATTLLKLRPNWSFRQQVKPGILSEWALDHNRHRSLANWQNLEKNTVTRGGLYYEISLLIRSIFMVISWIIT